MNLVRKFAAGFLALAIVAMPFQAKALDTVSIESTVQVANVTAGDTQYKDSVNAKTDEVVKVQVWYHNKENADSGKIANNLNVKLALPLNKAGKSQVVTSTVKADNSNTVVDTANINLALAQSQLEYIPGSAKWRHNAGSNEQQNWVTENLTAQQETALLSANGVTLENAKPCFNFESTVTVLMRVKTPAISIVKKVRIAGAQDKTWVVSNTAKPGDTLEYQLTVGNEGNTELKGVIIGDTLPQGMTYVAGSTEVDYCDPNVNDKCVVKTQKLGDNLTTGGEKLGDMRVGSTAKVYFKAKLATSDKFPKECVELKNYGIVRVPGVTNEIYNIAITKVCGTKIQNCTTNPERPECKPPVTPPTTPPVTTLPETGVEAPIAGLAGMSGMGYAVTSYIRSKKNLANALRNVRK
jgi:uncharacterized repeat protein (TIGR01451 family)